MNRRHALRRISIPACLALVLAGCAATTGDTDTLPAPTGGPEPVAGMPAPEEPAPEDGATADAGTTDPR